MKISVIGSGYVGLVTGACLADYGNSVICLDIDQQKIDLLNCGVAPIHEPGLQELIKKNIASGRLSFTTDIKKSVIHGVVQFIAVGTPSDEDGSADLQYVLSAAQSIASYMFDYKVIVDKSTVPVGTAEKVRKTMQDILNQRSVKTDFSVVSNPEFLKEGSAINDFMRPDRIVIGVSDDGVGRKAETIMRRLYAHFNRSHERIYTMDLRSAELTKYAANAMLATRISFMNELANLADEVGADIEKVRHGIGSDSRIGHSFLYAGAGYGGSCFPKDVLALRSTGQEFGKTLHILKAVHDVNNAQKSVLTRKIIDRFGEDLSGRTIALWGLAFKPQTDDVRYAPSRVLIADLVRRGAVVQAHDPVAIKAAKSALDQDLSEEPDKLANIVYCDSPEAALIGADFLVVMTEWKAYRNPDFSNIKAALKLHLIFDGRNIFNLEEMKEQKIEYHGIGRSWKLVSGVGN